MKVEQLKTWTDIVTAVVATAALVLGGLFGAAQYLEKARDDRVKETLNFLDRYNRDPVARARAEQQEKWRAHFDEEMKTPGSQYYAFIDRVIATEKLESSIAILNDFFATLEICARNNICEVEVALQLFQEDACSFFNRHYGFIMAQRKRSGDSSIGRGTEVFARDPRGLDSGQEISCIKRQPTWYDKLLRRRTEAP